MTRTVWTYEREAEAVRLVKSGMSAAKAGLLLGVSRNSVIGLLHRRGHVISEMRDRPKMKRPIVFNKKKEPAPREPYVAPVDPYVVPLDRRVSLVDLGAQQCRWIYGEPKHGPYHYCDQTRVLGSSYCSHHQKMSKPRDSIPDDASKREDARETV